MSLIEGNSDNFETEVLKSTEPVLVDFNASWCPPCRALHPTLEAMANDGYKIVTVDVDEEQVLAMQYEISSIPCLVVFANGQEIQRKVGLLPRKRLEKMMEVK